MFPDAKAFISEMYLSSQYLTLAGILSTGKPPLSEYARIDLALLSPETMIKPLSFVVLKM